MQELYKSLESLEPEEALAALTAAVKKILAGLDEELRRQFLLDLLGEQQDDKITSMVHL
jgi:hypothetical protein